MTKNTKEKLIEEAHLLLLEMIGNHAGSIAAFTKGTYREAKGVEMIIDFNYKGLKLQRILDQLRWELRSSLKALEEEEIGK